MFESVQGGEEEVLFTFDPQHTQMPVYCSQMQRDVKVDGYGRMLATSSADGSINVFELVEDGPPLLVATACDFEGPVNCIEWGPKDQHCRLASCGEDGKMVIYRFDNKQLRVEHQAKQQHAMTSVAWCRLEGSLALAASGVGRNILLFRYQWNEWRQIGVTDVLNERPEQPSFVCWSPQGGQHTYLLYGQGDRVVVYLYATSNQGDSWLAPEQSFKVQSPKEPNHQEIRDVTWEETLGGQQSRPLVLLGDQLIIFEHAKLNQSLPKKLPLGMGHNDFATKLGWSDEGTRLNIYCYFREEFTTLTLVCSFGGVWKILSGNQSY